MHSSDYYSHYDDFGSLDLTLDQPGFSGSQVKRDPYSPYDRPSSQTPPRRGTPRTRGSDRTPSGRGHAFSADEVKTLLYSIYSNDTPPQLTKRFEDAHGTIRTRAGIKQKSTALSTDLLKILLKKEETPADTQKEQSDDERSKALQFLGPHRIKVAESEEVFFAVYKSHFSTIKVAFDKRDGLVRFVLGKLPSGEGFSDIDGVKEVVLTFRAPQDYSIIELVDNDSIKGVRLKEKLSFEKTDERGLEDFY